MLITKVGNNIHINPKEIENISNIIDAMYTLLYETPLRLSFKELGFFNTILRQYAYKTKDYTWSVLQVKWIKNILERYTDEFNSEVRTLNNLLCLLENAEG